MKNTHRYMIMLVLLFATSLTACKKDKNTDKTPLSEAPQNFISIVDGFTVQVQWTPSVEEFDHYTLQFSKSADFSQLELTTNVDKSLNSYIYRNIDVVDKYFARIRTTRSNPESVSEWTNLEFTASKGSILLPISRESVLANSVTLRWELPANDPTLNKVTRIVLTPNMGSTIEIPLSSQQIQNKAVTYDKLAKDVKYTVRIYNQNFLRGTQTFITAAEPINGVWTLSPHSDLKAAIELSKSGDQIILKTGVYNFWNESILLENKSIKISAEANSSSKPKVYVNGFVLKGLVSGFSVNGIDFSGARINEFKQEFPNNADTKWNNWLILTEGISSTFSSIIFENCIIRNYNTGILKMIKGQSGNNLTINNSIVHHMGEDQLSPLIEVGAARIKEGIFSNSTYYMAGKMFILIDREANLNNDILFTFKNNTVDRSWSASAFDFKASKLPTKALLENNIFSNITCAANFFSNFSQPANDFDKRLINCNFYNVFSKATVYGSNQSNMPVHTWELRHPNFKWSEVKPAFVMNDGSHANPNSIKEYTISINPEYKNVANLDFTIPANNALRTFNGTTPLGDPRWW